MSRVVVRATLSKNQVSWWGGRGKEESKSAILHRLALTFRSAVTGAVTLYIAISEFTSPRQFANRLCASCLTEGKPAHSLEDRLYRQHRHHAYPDLFATAP